MYYSQDLWFFSTGTLYILILIADCGLRLNIQDAATETLVHIGRILCHPDLCNPTR